MSIGYFSQQVDKSPIFVSPSDLGFGAVAVALLSRAFPKARREDLWTNLGLVHQSSLGPKCLFGFKGPFLPAYKDIKADQFVGCVFFQQRGPLRYEIFNLAVDGGEQRQGIGETLVWAALTAIQDVAKIEHTKRELFLHLGEKKNSATVFLDSQIGPSYYQRFGFEEEYAAHSPCRMERQISPTRPINVPAHLRFSARHID